MELQIKLFIKYMESKLILIIFEILITIYINQSLISRKLIQSNYVY
jgi:hypothetical protein